MTAQTEPNFPLSVVIAGGSVAALEAALTLRELAGDRITIKLVAPGEDFVYRPAVVGEPFGYARAERHSLPEIAAEIGVELHGESLAWIDAGSQIAHTDASALPYDALLVAIGAQPHIRYEHAVTIDDRILDEQLHGLIQDVEQGYVQRMAFVVPGGMAWPLPIYELALMTATRALEMNVEVSITIVTPEESPLATFGSAVSHAVSALLAGAAVDVITSAYCEIPTPGRIRISPGHLALDVQRVVSLPELRGPAVRGLPGAPGGFIPVGPDGAVRGVQRVYAAGDATDFPIKHGGIAAQQADAAGTTIAALAGVDVIAGPFRPVVRGILMTGAKPLYLQGYTTGKHGFGSEISEHPLWATAGKIAAVRLGPYLETRNLRTATSS
jgi:sulfide:quinone oxidoreductase